MSSTEPLLKDDDGNEADGLAAWTGRSFVNPWAMLVAIAAGFVLARHFPDQVPYVSPIGEAFMKLMEMTIIPIVISATVSNLSSLLRRRNESRAAYRLLFGTVGLFGAVLFAGIAGSMLVSNLIAPSEVAYAAIGNLMFQQSAGGGVVDNWAVFAVKSTAVAQGTASMGWTDILLGAIPRNIFAALDDGNILQIVLFFALFAAMMRHLPDNVYHTIKNFFDGVFSVFMGILHLFYLFAVPGIAFFIAGRMLGVEVGYVLRFGPFAAALGAALILISAFAVFLVYVLSGRTLMETCRELRSAVLMAAAVNNRLLAIPQAMVGLRRIGFEANVVSSAVPLSVNLVCYGEAVVFAMGSVFCCLLYDVPLGPGLFVALFMTIPAASMMAVGAGPMVWYRFISLSLIPLGVSPEPVLIVLYALDPIISRLVCVADVCLGCALVAIINPRKTAMDADDGQASHE